MQQSSNNKGTESFDLLLTALSDDRNVSLERYKKLYDRLVRFFHLRGVSAANEAADETVDRVVRKLKDGVTAPDIVLYSYGIARLVALEFVRKEIKEKEAIKEFGFIPRSTGASDENPLMEFLLECLKELEGQKRRILLEYYAFDGHDPANRSAMASKNGIDLNQLRLQVFRLKKVLRRCVEGKRSEGNS